MWSIEKKNGMTLIQIKISVCHIRYNRRMLPPTPLTLDVRPLLKEGKEPLSAIIEAKSLLEAGQTLILLAPFEPKPLYARFETEGFSVEAKRIDTNDWEVHFIPLTSEADYSAQCLDLREVNADELVHRGIEAVARLARGQRLELLTTERPVAFLAELNADSTDYDCEPEAHKRYWLTTLWRL